MHVLLICERLDGFDGWSTYACTLAAGLRAQGHEVTVMTAKHAVPGGEYGALPQPLRLMSRPWKALLAARSLTKLLTRVRPDVIHITVEPYALLVPFLPAPWKRKTVLTIHGSYGVRLPSSRLLGPLVRSAFRCIPAFVTVSHYTKSRVVHVLRERKWHDCAEHVERAARVIHNGIALPPVSFMERKAAVRHILTVGPVKPRKGALEAVRACAAYREQSQQPFHFWIVGTVDERSAYVARVREEIARRGLSEHITFTGPVSAERLSELYAEAHLFLMPALTTQTTFEGFGLVYLEAAARGIPCIGPVDSGAAEAISDGRSGYRVHPENPREIAERMQWVLEGGRINPAQCRAWAEEHDVERQVRAMEKVYGAVCVYNF